ncbi:MAG TPA: hypothetical protein DEQ09_06470 [Bacteroidales bacterium]|nr:hypothetical protein [Bacteroidales bacterium]
MHFEKAINSESVEELKSFISDYPNSTFTDSANAVIEQLIWQKALLKNETERYEEYLTDYPNGQYVNAVKEKLEKKKEYLNLALKTFNKAQQINVKPEQKELYSRTDSLF